MSLATNAALYRAVAKLLTSWGWPVEYAAGWTAHTLRHRFATRTYAAARDLVAVQELLGHAKPETTRLYIETPPDSLRAAVAWAA